MHLGWLQWELRNKELQIIRMLAVSKIGLVVLGDLSLLLLLLSLSLSWFITVESGVLK
jgi:hypothetical protein